MSDKLLSALKAAAKPYAADVVSEWKRGALANVQTKSTPNQGLQLRLSYGFAFLVVLAALPLSGIGSIVSALALGLTLMVQELPIALVARASGRGVVTRLSAAGPDTTAGGQSLPRWMIVVGTLLGSIANLALASMWHYLARRHGPMAAAFGIAATTHAAWALAQGVPLLPFRAGRLLAVGVHVSLAFAFGTLSWVLLLALGLPLVKTLAAPALLPVVVLSTAFVIVEWRRLAAELNDGRAGVARLLQEAEARVQLGDAQGAVQLALRGLVNARVEAHRQRLLTTIAWGALGKGDPFLAHGAIHSLPPSAWGVHLLAAYLKQCNRYDEAEALLTQAQDLGERSRETSKLLIELLFRRGANTAALHVAERDRALLDASDIAALHEAGLNPS